MPQNSISAQLSNLHQLVADLEAIENGGKKAISNTIKDVKARAPGWIAQEVTAVYNIKKSEITPSGSGKPKKMAGSIQITGETIEELAITYKGRLLTPVHFGMTPKAPPRGKSYTLKAQVLKGQKKVVGRYTRPSSPSSKKGPASRSTRATSAGSSARLSCPCSLPSTTASTTSAGRRSSAMRGARCWTPSASGRT